MIVDGHLSLAIKHVISDEPLETDRIEVGLLQLLLVLLQPAKAVRVDRYGVKGQLAGDPSEPGLDLLPEQLAAHLDHHAASPHRGPVLGDRPFPAPHPLAKAVVCYRLIRGLHAINGKTFLRLQLPAYISVLIV